MTTPVKTPTQWRPQTGAGDVITPGNVKIVETVTMLPLVDTLTALPLLITPTITLPKSNTTWSEAG